MNKNITRELFGIYEIKPEKQNKPHGLVMGHYDNKAEAERDKLKYYNTDNYYVGPLVYRKEYYAINK